MAQVNVAVRQFTQTQAEGQSNLQDQSGIGHQPMVVEGDPNAVRVLAW